MISPIFGGGAIDGISLNRIFLSIDRNLGKGYIDIVERNQYNRLYANRFIYDRVIHNILQGLEILRLLEDSVQKATDILIKVKEKIVQAASADTEERKQLQAQINELIRNLEYVLFGFDFDGKNPYKGDTLVIQYGDKEGNFLVINGDKPDISQRSLVIGIFAGKDENSKSVIGFINKNPYLREKVAIWAYDGTTRQAYKLTLKPQETIFCIVAPGPIPVLPPPIRPCPQYIQLTFFVATNRQYQIQKSLEDAEKAIEYFNEIGSFWAQLAKTLQNNLELYLAKKDNLSFLLESKEFKGFIEQKLKYIKELFLKETAIKVYTSYLNFNRTLFNLLFSA